MSDDLIIADRSIDNAANNGMLFIRSILIDYLQMAVVIEDVIWVV